MNRLQSEQHRLYVCRPPSTDEALPPALIDPLGRVRALVLEVPRPDAWDVLGKVWHGVQSELELPAPAIAVSGVDGLQLWFSVEEPITVAQAHDFLDSLRLRFLAPVAPERIRMMPTSTSSAPAPARHARMVPGEHASTGNWSAFVAPDLAPIFAETPWLDIPPGDDGQAALLRTLASMTPAAFAAASARLFAGAPSPPPSTAGISDDEMASGHGPSLREEGAATAVSEEAKRFLRQVLNDDSVALALRVEAATALLRWGSGAALR